jgi:hypothetical protein
MDGPVVPDDDTIFLAAFEQQTLTRADWTHEAHVRMAWLLSRREPTREAALAKMCAGIRALNRALGTPDKLYHETVTRAFGSIVYARATRPGAEPDWPSFKAAFPDLFDPAKPILHRYYRVETLQSDTARLGYVPPDIGDGVFC